MSRRAIDGKPMNRDCAIRILEALSGIDEELLARSETAGKTDALAEKDRNQKTVRHTGAVIYGFVQKHGKAIAACMCLFVLGTAFWGMKHLAAGPFAGTGNTAKSADLAVLTEGTEKRESAIENPAEAAMAETSDGAAPETFMEAETDGGLPETSGGTAGERNPGVTADGTTSQEGLKESPVGAIAETAEDKSDRKETGKQESENSGYGQGSQGTAASKEITWEEAKKLNGLGTYVPDRLPKGYEPLSVCLRDEGEGDRQLTLLCSNGEKELWLNITEAEYSADVYIDSEPPVYTVTENWKELIPKADEEGGIRFGLLFEDDVLVEYRGYLTEREIQELFDSMQ